MTKRQLLVMTFLCAFAFGGVFGEFSNLEAKPKKKTTQTSKKKKSGKTSKSKNKTSGKKSSKKSSGKKTSKKTSKKSGKKKKGTKKKRSSRRNSNRVRTPRVYTPPTNGTYTPPKTYDNNTNTESEPERNERQYKRENTDPVKKEPKKDGE